jgi:hypothetical protein
VHARPILLLDLDGPLNPYRPEQLPAGYERHEIEENGRTWRVLLNPQHGVAERAAPVRRVSWKAPYVESGAAGPSFWVDDEVNDDTRQFLADGPGLGRQLVYRVDPARGLTPADFAAIRTWPG